MINKYIKDMPPWQKDFFMCVVGAVMKNPRVENIKFCAVGIGKTFVLKKVEEFLKEYSSKKITKGEQ